MPKYISENELDDLLHKTLQTKDYTQTYWKADIKETQETRYTEETFYDAEAHEEFRKRESLSDRMYSSPDNPSDFERTIKKPYQITITTTNAVLDIAKLLESAGYHPAFVKRTFNVSQHSIDSETVKRTIQIDHSDCEDLLIDDSEEASAFIQRELENLLSTQKKYPISINSAEKIIRRMNFLPAALDTLCQKLFDKKSPYLKVIIKLDLPKELIVKHFDKFMSAGISLEQAESIIRKREFSSEELDRLYQQLYDRKSQYADVVRTIKPDVEIARLRPADLDAIKSLLASKTKFFKDNPRKRTAPVNGNWNKDREKLLKMRLDRQGLTEDAASAMLITPKPT